MFEKLKNKAVILAVMASPLVTLAEEVVDNGNYTITTPPGCNVSTWITNAITALGGPVSIAIGGFFVFCLIVMALRWARLGMGGGKR